MLPDSRRGFKPAKTMDLGMKHARVRITADGREAEIHPMYDMWANASFIERINVTLVFDSRSSLSR